MPENTTPKIDRRAGFALIALVASASALAACGTTDVTKQRVEGALAPTFANLYVQQAAILGHDRVTVASTAAQASCDRGGPKVADTGPGAGLMSRFRWG